MSERLVFARTPDGHFFRTRFAGRDRFHNLILNGTPINPRIIEIFTRIDFRLILEPKADQAIRDGGSLHPQFGPNPRYSLESNNLDFLYHYWNPNTRPH